MGKDRKKIQQKKAQKAAKQRAKKAEHNKQLPLRGGGTPLSMRAAFEGEVYQCWEPAQLFDRGQGIGSVIITRKAQHKILMGVFLVDVFCLGVKDAFVRLLPEIEYQGYLGNIRGAEKLRATTPACARKLIEDAEAYARDLGLEPHRDYQKAKKIFGDIDVAECSKTYEFGQDGKPFYIAGPYDDQRFRDRVITTLLNKLGPDGFDYLMPLGEGPSPDFFD